MPPWGPGYLTGGGTPSEYPGEAYRGHLVIKITIRYPTGGGTPGTLVGVPWGDTQRYPSTGYPRWYLRGVPIGVHRGIIPDKVYHEVSQGVIPRGLV